jgi:glycine betaine/proline transport system permease protein
VFTGLGRLDVGMASLGGIGIVLMAIVLDRITQALGEQSRAGGRRAPLLERLGLRKKGADEDRQDTGDEKRAGG